jgi:phage antirepressor YoqD-like protein
VRTAHTTATRREQAKLLQRAFGEVGEDALKGWLRVNQALAGKSLQP